MLRLTNIGNLSTYNSATGLFEKITNCNIDIENNLIVNIDKNNRNGIENIIQLQKNIRLKKKNCVHLGQEYF